MKYSSNNSSFVVTRKRKKNELCPFCGCAVYFREIGGKTDKVHWEGYDYYCEKCESVIPNYHFPVPVFHEVQHQRRLQKKSKSKKILKETQLNPPIKINEYSWLVYNLGDIGQIEYNGKDKYYEFIDAKNKSIKQFKDIKQLIEDLEKI